MFRNLILVQLGLLITGNLIYMIDTTNSKCNVKYSNAKRINTVFGLEFSKFFFV